MEVDTIIEDEEDEEGEDSKESATEESESLFIMEPDHEDVRMN